MILRLAFFMLMAVGLLGFGTVAWISTRPPPAAAASAEPPPPTTKLVLTAAHAVRAGSLLKPEDLASKAVPITDPRRPAAIWIRPTRAAAWWERWCAAACPRATSCAMAM